MMKTNRILSLLLALILAVSLSGTAAAAPVTEQADSPEALAALLASGAETLGAQQREPTGRVLLRADTLSDAAGAQRIIQCAPLGIYVLEYETEARAETAHRALSAQLGADRCWLDTRMTGASVLDGPGGTNDSDPDPVDNPTPSPVVADYTPRSWGAKAMGLDLFHRSAAAAAHCEGRGLTIAVLDTGADLAANILATRRVSNASFDFVNNTREITDVTSGEAAGHGTMVTTLLDDLLPDSAELMLLRVFDDTGSASRTMVFTALEYALDHGADVINMSLGWEGADSTFTFLDTALERARVMGVPVICAAGNRNAGAETCYPASSPETIAVSAVNRALTHELFSNYGEQIDFAAPGSNVRTIGPGGTPMLSRGTSFAAPHVTTLAADMLLLRPELDSEAVYEAMKASAADLGDAGKDRFYGWGMPQLGDFLKQEMPHRWSAGRIDPLATMTQAGAQTFECEVCGETRTDPIPPTMGQTDTAFADVSPEQYFAAAVHWATVNAVTAGYSAEGPRFAPELACTRGQMVTFLWRAAGCPAPESQFSPFRDVQDRDAYYYRAVLWAVENGITSGTGPTLFSPGDTVTRAQTVTFLWRMADKPDADGENPFLDVTAEDYYFGAVLWAAETGVTAGTDSSHFSPAAPCTRGQIVTLLYRDLGSQ